MKRSSIIGAVEDVLLQGLALLSAIDAGAYQLVLPAPYQASVGQHYRHVLDHFMCLDIGLEIGRVDYDQRSRNREIETDIEYARGITAMLMHQFQHLSAESLLAPFEVVSSVGYRDAEAEVIASTVGRELAYSVGHAIHHFAIVRLLCAELDVTVPNELGIAPSTLKYRAEQAAS
jgi:hypothetical protein